MSKSKAKERETLKKEITTSNEDVVNHPRHYNFGRVETIDYIEDCIGKDGEINYCIGNCIKYISRANYKGNRKQDLEKARWYLDRAISVLSSESADKSCE